MRHTCVRRAVTNRRLWLVRHGETEGTSLRFHGHNDVRLSDVGRQQIRDLVPLLLGVDFVRVVHSPLLRAAESAAILAAGCAIAPERVHADDRLREIGFGACEGLTAEEIAARYPDFWREHRAGTAAAFPAGEYRLAFRRRVDAAIQHLVAEPWSGDLLLVAHRGTVRQALRWLLRLPDSGLDPFGVELASLSIAREADGWQLDVLGMLP